VLEEGSRSNKPTSHSKLRAALQALNCVERFG
jgi:hypothetical protein